MMNRRFVKSNIHGRFSEFIELLELVNYKTNTTHIQLRRGYRLLKEEGHQLTLWIVQITYNCKP